LNKENIIEHWSSRAGFLFAATGASVGIGNIWKFPYMTGANGGSAFILVYILCIVFVALPLLIAELLIGRRAHMGPPNALLINAKLDNRSHNWVWLGWLFMITGFLILSFFSVVSGWILDYLYTAVVYSFENANFDSTHAAFESMLQSPLRMTLAHLVFMSINVLIVSFGLKRGIERVASIFMPMLLVLLVLMTAYSFYAGAPSKALHFLFHFDLSSITNEVVLMAAGQSFLSIGLCSGMMMICGAYLPNNISIPRMAVIIASTDTVIAILAGLLIFPLVFGYGLQPAQGPGLIFETLPIAFAQMPMGYLFGISFFLLLFFASVTSSVALLEHVVSWFMHSYEFSRIHASIIIGVSAWFLGLISVVSFNLLADLHPFAFISGFEKKSIFDVLDYLATNVLLVVGGFLLAIFGGWIMKKELVLSELGFKQKILAQCWYFTLRYIAPLVLGIVMISKIWN
jgi:neurotransmitter:Na+ symporter, NSS family